MQKKVAGYCALCISRCGCISTVENGILTKVEANPEHPTGSSLCIKGRSATELVYNKKRILKPLIRINSKNEKEPKWQSISWGDALNVISKKLSAIKDKSGSESVAFSVTTPSATAICDSFAWIHRLAYAFGSPNILFATENCNWHKDFTPRLTFGDGIGMPDYEHSGCIIVWGFNPTVTWPTHAKQITKAVKRGAKLIVIDPRKIGLATKAHQYLQIQPASDGILAMCLAQEMIKQDLFDETFIKRWSNGPLLVRKDTGELLCGDNLPHSIKEHLNVDNRSIKTTYFAWHQRKKSLVVYDSISQQYLLDNDVVAEVDLQVLGDIELQTETGVLLCQPAFSLYRDICNEYDLNEVVNITGIEAEQIKQTARVIAKNGPVSFFTWTGTAQQAQATQTARALNLLYALTGSLHAKGGNVQFSQPALNNVFGKDLLNANVKKKNLGVLSAEPELTMCGPGDAMSWVNTVELNRSIIEGLPYRTKALVSFGGNPMLTKPEVQRTNVALESLDFYLHIDMFMNASSSKADMILPAASSWERSGLQAGFMVSQKANSLLQLRSKVIEPQGESKSDTKIVFELAKALGLQSHFFEGDINKALEYTLIPTKITSDVLKDKPEGIYMDLNTVYKPYLEHGFNTPSKKIEIFSQALHKRGELGIPKFSLGDYDVNPLYPLRLVSAKVSGFCHSQHRTIPTLRKRFRMQIAEVHPTTATEFGIIDGEKMMISTGYGNIIVTAKMNNALAINVVCCQYGWWGKNGEENYAALVNSARSDTVSGSNSLRDLVCNISAC